MKPLIKERSRTKVYTHRRLSHDDLDTICEFPQTEEELYFVSPRFKYPLTSEQILELLKDRFEPIAVIDAVVNKVVAYANLYGHDPSDCSCWLGNVIVSPEYRGKGAAEFLVQMMIQEAENKFGIHTIQLSCHNTNSRGLAFYYKNGFKPFDMKIKMLEGRKVITIQMKTENRNTYS